MVDDRRAQLLEQYEDIALALLLDEYAEVEGAGLLQEFEDAKRKGELPELPSDLDKKCRQLIDKTFTRQQRNDRLKRIGKSIVRVAVIASVFLGLSVAMVLSVEALRTPVFNFLMDKAEKYTTVKFENDSDTESEHTKNVIFKLEEILPSGYQEITKISQKDGSISAFYQNDEGDIISLVAEKSSGKKNIDTEHAISESIILQSGYEVLFIEKEGYRVIWAHLSENLIYDFYASGVERDAFWEMVEYIVT